MLGYRSYTGNVVLRQSFFSDFLVLFIFCSVFLVSKSWHHTLFSNWNKSLSSSQNWQQSFTLCLGGCEFKSRSSGINFIWNKVFHRSLNARSLNPKFADCGVGKLLRASFSYGRKYQVPDLFGDWVMSSEIFNILELSRFSFFVIEALYYHHLGKRGPDMHFEPAESRQRKSEEDKAFFVKTATKSQDCLWHYWQ